jgi:hypothetical protein
MVADSEVAGGPDDQHDQLLPITDNLSISESCLAEISALFAAQASEIACGERCEKIAFAK